MPEPSHPVPPAGLTRARLLRSGAGGMLLAGAALAAPALRLAAPQAARAAAAPRLQLEGVPLDSAVPRRSWVSSDYRHFAEVDPAAGPDLEAALAGMQPAIVDPFDRLDLRDPHTGRGFWQLGVAMNINSEYQMYPLKAWLDAVGLPYPVSASDGVLTVTLDRLDPRLRPHIAELRNLDDPGRIVHQSGWLDTFRSLDGVFFPEGGLSYVEVVVRLPRDAWPCSLWTDTAEGTWPDGESDLGEKFGDVRWGWLRRRRFLDQTEHYANTTTGHGSIFSRTVLTDGTPWENGWHSFGRLIDHRAGVCWCYVDRQFTGELRTVNQAAPGWRKARILQICLASSAGTGAPKPPAVLPELPVRLRIAGVRVWCKPDPAIPASTPDSLPEAAAAIAATGADGATAAALDGFFRALHRDGFLLPAYRPHHLFVFAGLGERGALVDLMHPERPALGREGELAWHPRDGFQGDGAGWLQSGIDPEQLDLDDLTLGCWLSRKPRAAFPVPVIGTEPGAAAQPRLAVHGPGRALHFGFGDPGGGSFALDVGDVLGFSAVCSVRPDPAAPRASLYGVNHDVFFEGRPGAAERQPPRPGPLRFVGGDLGVAMLWLAPGWQPPRVKLFRENAVKPLARSLGWPAPA